MGLSEHPKTSDKYEKVWLVSFWSEKSSNGATLATWSVLDEKMRSSVDNSPSRIALEKVKDFELFRKIKKLQKLTFAFWHTCTTFFGVLRGQNRKVAF